jgi:hypothetical protein
MITFTLSALKCNNLHTEQNLSSEVTLSKFDVNRMLFLKKYDWKVGSCTISIGIRKAEVICHSSTVPRNHFITLHLNGSDIHLKLYPTRVGTSILAHEKYIT